ncbi:hypothetical protein HID58_062467 [Brassica napus]|uniref:Uncharacterized protein n=1 Tax=Brassica napus TaxID=3708 RepID=A0ABQ8A2H1_BRANA|nr:hypothetical protein HID58_062467 [Brassica napus]
MASYVFNNNYLKNGLADEACSFNNNAALTSINPSQGTCRYHSSKRVSNGRVVDDNFNGCRTSRYEPWLTGFQQLFGIEKISLQGQKSMGVFPAGGEEETSELGYE